MLRTNETRYMSWYETFACKYRLDACVCNDRHRCNSEKCICECKELIDKVRCDDRFIWNLSPCECECDKLYDVGQYLDYVNCKYRKRLIDRLYEKGEDLMKMKWSIIRLCMNMKGHAKFCMCM